MPGGRTHAATTQTGRPGRPSALSEETIQVIIRELTTALASYQDAARAAFIDPRTFDRWREKGRKDLAKGRETEYSRFYRRLEEANLRVKRMLTTRVLASRDPKLALKILERRWPEEWGQKIKMEVVAPRQSPREKVESRLSAIEKRLKGAEDLQTESGEPVASGS